MKQIVETTIFLILVLLPLFTQAHAKTTITWLQNDFPPAWIMDGPFKDQGPVLPEIRQETSVQEPFLSGASA